MEVATIERSPGAFAIVIEMLPESFRSDYPPPGTTAKRVYALRSRERCVAPQNPGHLHSTFVEKLALALLLPAGANHNAGETVLKFE